MNPELLAQILAAPDDDAPRLVYADWLLERGDARGELIQLSCLAAARALTQAEQERYDELACEHPLRGILRAPTFGRGFVVDAILDAHEGARITASIGDPEWLFLRTIELAAASEDAIVTLLGSSDLQGLERLTGAPLWILDRVFAQSSALPGLRSIELRGAAPRLARWLDDPRCLPRLEEIIVSLGSEHSPIRSSWVLATSLGHRITRLRLRLGAPVVREWLAELARVAPPNLREVTLGVPGEELLELRRGPLGAFSELTILPALAIDSPATRLVRHALEALPPGTWTRLTVRRPER